MYVHNQQFMLVDDRVSEQTSTAERFLY